MNRRQVFGMFAGLAALPAMGFNWVKHAYKRVLGGTEILTASLAHRDGRYLRLALHEWDGTVKNPDWFTPIEKTGCVLDVTLRASATPAPWQKSHYRAYVPGELDKAEQKLRELKKMFPDFRYIDLFFDELHKQRDLNNQIA